MTLKKQPKTIRAAVLVLAAAPLLFSAAEARADDRLSNDPLAVNVMVLNYSPSGAATRGQELWQYAGWHDPAVQTQQFTSQVHSASHGFINYNTPQPGDALWVDINAIPEKADGFQYTLQGYVDNLNGTGAGWHHPDTVDYGQMIEDHNIASLVNSGAVDEVWVMGAPYFGYWESTMAGPGAFWINGPTQFVPEAERPFVLMGFNYERHVNLHALGHRAESTMSRFFQGWDMLTPDDDWDLYTANAARTSAAWLAEEGNAYGVGDIHHPANGITDYDYSNFTAVESTAEFWGDYPFAPNGTSVHDSSLWGSNEDAYLDYWFSNLPHAQGVDPDTGRINNWWKYIYDYTQYSRFDGTPLYDLPIAGDLNGDGFVGFEDLNILLANWGQSVERFDRRLGDATGDGLVNADDLALVQLTWGEGTSGGTDLPEPGSMSLFALVVLVLCSRRPRPGHHDVLS